MWLCTNSGIAKTGIKTQIIVLPNKRIYKVVDSENPYIEGEYPSGGYVISVYDERFSRKWVFIDYSPNIQTLNAFLKAARKLN